MPLESAPAWVTVATWPCLSRPTRRAYLRPRRMNITSRPRISAAGKVSGKKIHSAIGPVIAMTIEKSSHQLKEKKAAIRAAKGTWRGGSARRPAAAACCGPRNALRSTEPTGADTSPSPGSGEY